MDQGEERRARTERRVRRLDPQLVGEELHGPFVGVGAVFGSLAVRPGRRWAEGYDEGTKRRIGD